MYHTSAELRVEIWPLLMDKIVKTNGIRLNDRIINSDILENTGFEDFVVRIEKNKKKQMEGSTCSTTYRWKMDRVLNWQPYTGKQKQGKCSEDGQVT